MANVGRASRATSCRWYSRTTSASLTPGLARPKAAFMACSVIARRQAEAPDLLRRLHHPDLPPHAGGRHHGGVRAAARPISAQIGADMPVSSRPMRPRGEPALAERGHERVHRAVRAVGALGEVEGPAAHAVHRLPGAGPRRNAPTSQTSSIHTPSPSTIASSSRDGATRNAAARPRREGGVDLGALVEPVGRALVVARVHHVLGRGGDEGVEAVLRHEAEGAVVVQEHQSSRRCG